MSTVEKVPTAANAPAATGAGIAKKRTFPNDRTRRLGAFAISVVLGLAVWQLLARHFGPALLATPAATWGAGVELARDGDLWEAVRASCIRILAGWSLGLVVGVPLGLLMGRIRAIRLIVEPYIEFFRFIPPIAFVTLAVIWFGIGETSKIVLIFYTSVFVVVINTIAGAVATDENKLRAAASLGASKAQILWSVVLPSTIPYIVTGGRLAMGNSFLTIVSAEIVAAQAGLGFLIWNARNYGRIDWVFVGIIALGIIGYLFDQTLRLAVRPLSRYKVKL